MRIEIKRKMENERKEPNVTFICMRGLLATCKSLNTYIKQHLYIILWPTIKAKHQLLDSVWLLLANDQKLNYSSYIFSMPVNVITRLWQAHRMRQKHNKNKAKSLTENLSFDFKTKTKKMTAGNTGNFTNVKCNWATAAVWVVNKRINSKRRKENASWYN